MHPAPSDGHWEGELEMSISIHCHVLNKTGQVWIDTDKPRVDTLSTRTKAIPRDKWQAAPMPHLTAACTCTHAGRQKIVRGASDTHVHPRPYGQAGLASFKRRLKELSTQCLNKSKCWWRHCMLICVVRSAERSPKQQIDISDSASIARVSVFTLLNAQ